MGAAHNSIYGSRGICPLRGSRGAQPRVGLGEAQSYVRNYGFGFWPPGVAIGAGAGAGGGVSVGAAAALGVGAAAL